MREIINKKNLEKLAHLSRIEIDKGKEEKLLKDLGEIINYFEELKGVDTSKTEPMNGGVLFSNAIRYDESETKCESQNADLISAFSDKKDNYLKVPGVFGE
ncbi:Asp-tRNA(Asn)/Glu-tRNA(Gln) amidotransferase subunit GatC [Candidatus Wolfebacteria bacterium]|nr:Asp-tRNA(Asn)/Glu-tRNA(Gln) amidotransferase subunit GatC [Candidatus Wolfebacteria bacterium]